MLQITISLPELWDESKQEFIHQKEQSLQLEHSLVSISKWESRWKKSFLSRKEKTYEETIDYIRCMTITQNINPIVYYCLSDEDIETVSNYIEDSMTATHFFGENNSETSRETITSELIYYWMVSFGIPFECQKWHLNRLLSLIKVCIAKNKSQKHMNKHDLARRNSLNATRRKRLNTKG